jgi:hypothetical protein
MLGFLDAFKFYRLGRNSAWSARDSVTTLYDGTRAYLDWRAGHEDEVARICSWPGPRARST